MFSVPIGLPSRRNGVMATAPKKPSLGLCGRSGNAALCCSGVPAKLIVRPARIVF